MTVEQEHEGIAARVDAAIDVAAMVAACQLAVQTPSLSFQEQRVARLLVDHMRRLGFDEVDIDLHGNVIGRLIGHDDGPSVMFNGHMDHVPAGQMANPFSGDIVDAARWGEPGLAIYGRGSCDMKCNVMASAHAIAAIKKAGLRLRGDVLLVADIGEEVDSPNGVRAVVASGLRADYGISTESTQGRVYLGHRGKIDAQITVHGRTAHASEPSNGVNAVYKAGQLIQAVQRHADRLTFDDPLMGPATLATISVHSTPDNGTAVVPDRCVVRVDRRYVRGETGASVEAELQALIASVRAHDPGFHADYERMIDWPLMFVEESSPIVRSALWAQQSLRGAAALGAWRFGVNGTFMCQAGIPTIGLGPGNEIWAHTPDEHILIDDLAQACRLWTRTLIHLIGLVPG